MSNLRAYRRFRADIAEMLDPRCYTIEWLDERVEYGDAHVFGDDDAVIVVEERQYPAGACEVHGLVAAGSVPAILKLIDEAEVWGRERGCVFAAIASRPGWARILSGRGYALHQTEIRKELV